MAGTYNVRLTASNTDCTDETEQTVIVNRAVSTGIDDWQNETVSIFGVEHSITIMFNQAFNETFTLNLGSASGQSILKEVTINPEQPVHSIDLPDISPGY